MADVKISALPADVTLLTTDIVPVVDLTATVTKKATVAQFRAAMMPVSLSVDVTGSLPVTSIAPSVTNTQVLTTVGGVTTWATAPSGFTAGGDLTGTSTSQTVAKINGSTVPAGGALTTGNVLQVSGAGALSYGPVNLAGGVNYVTGTLPTGNQASQTMAGDVTGTTAASTVAKVKGTTITTAGGALTTGVVLRATAVGTADWGALDLANASATTGQLPLGGMAAPTGTGVVTTTAGAWQGAARLLVNADISGTAAISASKVVQATGTGFPHVTAGVLDTASIKVDTTNSAHVTVPGTTDGVVTTNGSVLQQAANVLAGSGFISIGVTPAASGLLRTPLSSVILTSRNSINSNDNVALAVGASDNLQVGVDASYTAATQFSSVNIYAGTAVGLGVGSTSYFYMIGGATESWKPIKGSSSGTSPYSVHGKTTVATTGSFTVAASDYQYDAVQFTSAAGGTVTFPLPASDSGAYYKTIIYSGNGTLVVTNGGGAPKNVSLATNTTQRLLFDTAGVHPVSAAVAYP